MIQLKDTVPVLLRVPAEQVSRHRGYIVHRSVGDDSWTLSVACGVKVADFPRRTQAEHAMRRLSEVLDVEAWPDSDLHRVMVLWDRVPKATLATMVAVIEEARGQ